MIITRITRSGRRNVRYGLQIDKLHITQRQDSLDEGIQMIDGSLMNIVHQNDTSLTPLDLL